MGIKKDQIFSISEEVLFQEVSGELVLLDLSGENYFGLDEIGARIWQLLDQGRSVGELLDTLLDEYNVSREILENDLEELLGKLSEAGLISA